MRRALLLIAVAFLAGCSKPRIDASSEEAFAKSVEKVSASLPEAQRAKFGEAVAVLTVGDAIRNMGAAFSGAMAAALSGQKPSPPPSALEMMKPLNGKTADEIIALADQRKAEVQKQMTDASAQTARTSAVELAGKATQAAYIPHLEIRKLTAQRRTLMSTENAEVEGEIKNLGDRSLDRVEVTITLLDSAGKGVSEDKTYPVLVAAHFGGDGSDMPLKPNFTRRIHTYVEHPPSEWAGKVEARVTAIEFSKE